MHVQLVFPSHHCIYENLKFCNTFHLKPNRPLKTMKMAAEEVNQIKLWTTCATPRVCVYSLARNLCSILSAIINLLLQNLYPKLLSISLSCSCSLFSSLKSSTNRWCEPQSQPINVVSVPIYHHESAWPTIVNHLIISSNQTNSNFSCH